MQDLGGWRRSKRGTGENGEKVGGGNIQRELSGEGTNKRQWREEQMRDWRKVDRRQEENRNKEKEGMKKMSRLKRTAKKIMGRKLKKGWQEKKGNIVGE